MVEAVEVACLTFPSKEAAVVEQEDFRFEDVVAQNSSGRHIGQDFNASAKGVGQFRKHPGS